MTSSTQYNQSSNINIQPKQQQHLSQQQQQSRHQQYQQQQQYPRASNSSYQQSYRQSNAPSSAVSGPPFDLTPGITPVPGKPNYYTLTRRGLKNSLYAAEDCPKCGVTASTPVVRLPHTRVPPPGTRANRVWNKKTEHLFQPFFRGSCPEFGPSGAVYGSAPTVGFNPLHRQGLQQQQPHLRSLPEPKCNCSRKQNPLHHLHDHAVTVTDQQQRSVSRHQSYYPHSSAPPSPPLPRSASSLQYYYSPQNRRRRESLFDKSGFDRDPPPPLQQQQQKYEQQRQQQGFQHQSQQPIGQKHQQQQQYPQKNLQKQLTFQDESYNQKTSQSPRRQPQIQSQKSSQLQQHQISQQQSQPGRILTIPRIEVRDDSDLQTTTTTEQPAVKSSQFESRKDRDIINRTGDRDQQDFKTNNTGLRGKRESEEDFEQRRRREEEEDQRREQRRLHREQEEKRQREEDEEDRQRQLERERRLEREQRQQQELEERLRREEEEEDRLEQERLRKRRTDEEKRRIEEDKKRIEEQEEEDRRRRRLQEERDRKERELKEAEEQLQRRREERDHRIREQVTQQLQRDDQRDRERSQLNNKRQEELDRHIDHRLERRDSRDNIDQRRTRCDDEKLYQEENDNNRRNRRQSPPSSLIKVSKSTAEENYNSYCPHSGQQRLCCQESSHHCCCCATGHSDQGWTDCTTCNMPSRSDVNMSHHHHPHHPHQMHSNQTMHQVQQPHPHSHPHAQSSSEFNSPTHHQHSSHHGRHHHPQEVIYASPPSTHHPTKSTGGFNSLIPQLQKVVKFNLNPSYSNNRSHGSFPSRPGRSSPHHANHVPVISSKTMPSRTSHPVVHPSLLRSSGRNAAFVRSRSFEEIASQETGVDLDPDVLSRNKRNLPQAPSFKHATSPTLPMAKMRAFKEMITNTDLNLKRKMQVSPIPRYSLEHDFKFGSKGTTTDRSMGMTSYLSGKQKSSLPGSPSRPLSRNSPLGSFFGASVGAANNMTASSNICSDPCCTDPNCPANYPVLHHVTASSNYPSGRVAFSNPDLRVGSNLNSLNQQTQGNNNYRFSFQSQIHPDYSIATPPRYVMGSHQHHHQHPNQTGHYYSSSLCSSPTFVSGPLIPHSVGGKASFLSSINQHHHHQMNHGQHHHHGSSSIGVTNTSITGTTIGNNSTTTNNMISSSTKQFPSVSEITRPPFMEPTYNFVDKYDYNYDNFYKAKREKLQPFFRYSSAPPSRSTTPVNGFFASSSIISNNNHANNVANNNPFMSSMTPPPPASICSSATLAGNIINKTTGLTSSGKIVAANNAGTQTSPLVNPNLTSKNVNLNNLNSEPKQMFKSQLKYFIEERKGQLGMGSTLQPQTGSESDVTALLNMYSNPPDPVKAKFPPPGASTYQSVPQAYFDPRVTQFTPMMLSRRHSFGGGESSMMYRGSPSPYPSFYASYAPPTASSLLHQHLSQQHQLNHQQQQLQHEMQQLQLHQQHQSHHHAHHINPRTSSYSFSNIHSPSYLSHSNNYPTHQILHGNQPMYQSSSSHPGRPSSPYPRNQTMYLTGDDALDYALYSQPLSSGSSTAHTSYLGGHYIRPSSAQLQHELQQQLSTFPPPPGSHLNHGLVIPNNMLIDSHPASSSLYQQQHHQEQLHNDISGMPYQTSSARFYPYK